MPKSPVTVVVVAPHGAGKSRHAAALAARFGCTHIVDEWDGKLPVPPGSLVLTNLRLDELAKPTAQREAA